MGLSLPQHQAQAQALAGARADRAQRLREAADERAGGGGELRLGRCA